MFGMFEKNIGGENNNKNAQVNLSKQHYQLKNKIFDNNDIPNFAFHFHCNEKRFKIIEIHVQ